MDDHELETRLRAHLHRRFDDALPPSDLVGSVQQVVATPPRRVGLADLRVRGLRTGWAPVVGVVLVAVLTVAGLRLGGLIGPGQGDPTPQPTAVPPTERAVMVVPPTDEAATRAQTELAAEVFSTRLRALGFETLTRTPGNGIGYLLPLDGPTDTEIHHALTAAGDVKFVPLPPEDYGEGKLVAQVGGALPKDAPALFGWDGIASVSIGTDQQDSRVLDITLTPGAREAFAAYTAEHVNETFAVLIDGLVALLPTVNEPISGGQIQISGGSATEDFNETMAILVGGLLPESWHGAKAADVIPESEIVAGIMFELSGATLESATLDAIDLGGRWVAVWRIELGGTFVRSCPNTPTNLSPTCPPPTAGPVTYILDAESGDQISMEAP